MTTAANGYDENGDWVGTIDAPTAHNPTADVGADPDRYQLSEPVANSIGIAPSDHPSPRADKVSKLVAATDEAVGGIQERQAKEARRAHKAEVEGKPADEVKA